MVFCQGSITSRPTPGISGAGCRPHPLDLVDHDEPRQCLQSELGLRQARKVAGIFQVEISVGGQSPGKGGFSAFTSKRPIFPSNPQTRPPVFPLGLIKMLNIVPITLTAKQTKKAI